jgi:hypothetical protein
MSQTVFGAQAVVTMLNRAFNNTSPANAVFNNQVATAGSTEASQTAFALQFGTSFAGLTDAQLSARVLGNLGVLPNAELEAAVTQYFADNGLANRGLVVLQLGQILSTLETAPAPQNIFNDAAKAWNTEVEKSFIYSSSTSSTTPYVGDFAPTPVGQGQTFTLTVGQDYADSSSSFKNGGLITSDFKFSSGNETVTAGAGTLASNDALVDGSTTDADVLNATLTSGGPLTTSIQNIETLNLTSTIANSGLNFANVLGAKKVTLTGTANSQLTNVNATAAPAFEINNYNKAVTLNVATLGGTTAAGTAESLTVKASGLTAGGTVLAPVIPTLNLTSAGAGTLETLNLESAGTTKNTLQLTGIGAGNVNAVAKTVVTGAADLDLLMAHGAINGQTLDAAGHTGVLNLIVDRNGATTAVTNLTNVTGADVYTFRDSTAGGDALVASGLASGSTVALTYTTAGGASSLAVKGAAAGKADSLTLVLDNAADATNTTVASSLTVTDVETLNIKSEGGTTTGNKINALTVTAGSTVSVDGATKLDLELAAASLVSVVEVKGAGAHKVDFAGAGGVTYADGKNLTIDGSTATGKLTLDGSQFTGTAGGSGAVETLTIRGGENDDTITAHTGVDARSVIDAGAGKDTVNVATAANVTLGLGADTLNLTGLTGGITVTDFALGAGGDVLSVDTGAAVAFGGVGAAGVAGQLIIANASVANDVAAKLLVNGAAGEYAVIVINDATGVAELWYDANGGAGGEVKLATFENITTVGVLTDATSGFVAANFGTWA